MGSSRSKPQGSSYARPRVMFTYLLVVESPFNPFIHSYHEMYRESWTSSGFHMVISLAHVHFLGKNGIDQVGDDDENKKLAWCNFAAICISRLCLPTCGRISCRPTHSLKPRKVQRRLKSLGLSYDDIPSSCAHVSGKCDWSGWWWWRWQEISVV